MSVNNYISVVVVSYYTSMLSRLLRQWSLGEDLKSILSSDRIHVLVTSKVIKWFTSLNEDQIMWYSLYYNDIHSFTPYTSVLILLGCYVSW